MIVCGESEVFLSRKCLPFLLGWVSFTSLLFFLILPLKMKGKKWKGKKIGQNMIVGMGFYVWELTYLSCERGLLSDGFMYKFEFVKGGWII